MMKTTKIILSAAVALSLADGIAEAQTWYGTGNNAGGGWQGDGMGGYYGTGNNAGGGWQYSGNGAYYGTGNNAGGGWQSDGMGGYYGTGNNAGSGYIAPSNPNRYNYNYPRPCVAALERC